MAEEDFNNFNRTISISFCPFNYSKGEAESSIEGLIIGRRNAEKRHAIKFPILFHTSPSALKGAAAFSFYRWCFCRFLHFKDTKFTYISSSLRDLKRQWKWRRVETLYLVHHMVELTMEFHPEESRRHSDWFSHSFEHHEGGGDSDSDYVSVAGNIGNRVVHDNRSNMNIEFQLLSPVKDIANPTPISKTTVIIVVFIPFSHVAVSFLILTGMVALVGAYLRDPFS